jgi:hypothetical protein
VGCYSELVAELHPSITRGRFGGRFEVAVDNRGNVPAAMRVDTTDPEQSLRLDAKPTSFDAAPGSATFSRLIAKPHRRLWRGQAKPCPFELLVSATPSPHDDSRQDTTIAPVVLNGTYVQEARIPEWLPKALLLVTALAIALLVLWKTLLKPVVESAARDVAIQEAEAVDEQIAELAEAVDTQEQLADEAVAAVDQAAAAVEEQLEAADEAAAEAEDKVNAAVEELDEAVDASEDANPAVLADTSNPANFRLSVAAPVGESRANSFPVDPPVTTFALTDVILQNPGGDVGRLRIMIGGEPIIESALENFRDLDFHFISPYVVDAGSNVSVELDCAIDQLIADDPCEAAVSFAGFTSRPPEEGS